MPNKQDAFHKLDIVREEFTAAKFCLTLALRMINRDPSVHRAGSNLEPNQHL